MPVVPDSVGFEQHVFPENKPTGPGPLASSQTTSRDTLTGIPKCMPPTGSRPLEISQRITKRDSRQ